MSDQSGAKLRGGFLKWALWGAALIGVAAVLYIIVQASIKPHQETSLTAVARGEMKKLVAPAETTVAPTHVFYDAAGKPVRAADFKGKVLVLNLWATWCAPCIAEMPTLAKLAAAYAGKPVAVVAVSVDTPADADKAKTFIAKQAPLAFYGDPEMKLPFALKPPAAGMPTTIIYGADGLERGRLSGGADWSGVDARQVIDQVLADQ
ncbi:TlpA disulfide reductase family protein [Phenylobacterium sp. LjRoot225]|uniref:TlpA family protein disulfide reductase n=1 Tax=Phenylobacterium sp. LjRoot225 TaxID=3342285 RepID=UPI003ECF56DD